LKINSKQEFSFVDEFNVSSELSSFPQLLHYKQFGTFTHESEERKFEYMVTDFMPNGTLFDYVSNNGFDEDCARFLFKHILKGIESMHDSGYAHLDLKLGNILLDMHYQPKICDYGFSQRVSKEDFLPSKEFECFGTKNYISPEIFTDEVFNCFGADIFALGVAFFILMVGDYPFSKATKSDSKYQHMFKKDPFVFWRKHARAKKKRNKGLISDELVDLLTMMMIPDQEKRITVDQIKGHPWYQEPSMEISKVKEYMKSQLSLKTKR